jgi:hypothetical protein
MKRIPRDSSTRSEPEQQWILQNTWRDACDKADLGMSSPQEYEENGCVFVEGYCKVCGQRVRSEVHEIEHS